MAALVGALLIALSVYLCYRFAENLERLLGKSAMNVIMRLSSFLLLCIGVQILWNGVTGLLKSIGKMLRCWAKTQCSAIQALTPVQNIAGRMRIAQQGMHHVRTQSEFFVARWPEDRKAGAPIPPLWRWDRALPP